MARPSEYNIKICNEICERIVLGEHIKPILDSNKDYPTFPTWCKWKRENDELFNLYYSIPRMQKYKIKNDNKGKYNKEGKFDRNLYERDRRKENPKLNMSQRISSLIRDSFGKKRNYSFKKELTTEQILGCSIDFFINHIEKQFKKGMNWDNRDKWHLDHIKPISYAKDKKEIIELNHYTNFQPLFAKDNLAKGNKYIG